MALQNRMVDEEAVAVTGARKYLFGGSGCGIPALVPGVSSPCSSWLVLVTVGDVSTVMSKAPLPGLVGIINTLTGTRSPAALAKASGSPATMTIGVRVRHHEWWPSMLCVGVDRP